MQLRSRILAVLVASTAIATAANATPSGADFVKKVSGANQFEIQTSQLALDKSKNESINVFAQQMVDDHTEASANLAAALDNSNVKTQPQDDVDAKHAKLLAKLDGTSGAAFDRQYVALQTDAHKEAVALFSDYAAHGKDPALKQFAQTTLPTLKMHLKHVKELAAK